VGFNRQLDVSLTNQFAGKTTRQMYALVDAVTILFSCQRIVLSAKCIAAKLVCQRNFQEAFNPLTKRSVVSIVTR